MLPLDAGGCGGCAAAVEEALLSPAGRGGRDGAMPRPVARPGEADMLLVSGCVTAAMRDAVGSCRRALPVGADTVAVGDCAIDGGPFRGYAVPGGLAGDGVLAIGGCPPAPERIAAVLAGGGDAAAAEIRREAPNEGVAVPATDRALLHPEPRHRLGGDGSSGG
ncbi:MAG: hypothetical protein INR65_01030 [Gluconacetobacter diazotrophicus]|nr:hypothetical protein [Gluconacetobacter diazotrophicus]